MRYDISRKNEIAKGSLQDVAVNSGMSIAETFIGADTVVMVDTSGSMSAEDSRDGQSRYDVAVNELRDLQATLAGRVAVISFACQAHFVPNGIPHNASGTTNLVDALTMAKIADVADIRFFLISDGTPSDSRQCLVKAAEFNNQIDTIFVGRENEQGAIDYMNELARVSGGLATTSECVKELSQDIQLMLTASA